MPVKFFALCLLLFCSGCALPAALEGPSLAVSVASLGQTAFTAYDAAAGQDKTLVSEMPAQYLHNRERMLVEMWEAGYYLVRALHWEEEEMTPGEQTMELRDQARLCNAEFVLLGKQFLRRAYKREEYAVYITPSGELAAPPPLLAEPPTRNGNGAGKAVRRPSEPYSVELRESVVSYDIFSYSAYFFVPDERGDGILATDGPWAGPCRGAYSYGAQIVALKKSSPAKAAGLQPGDVIASVNGQPAEPGNLNALFVKGINEVSFCRQDQKQVRQVYQP